MLPGKKYLPEDLLRLAWRGRWLILVPFAVIATATVVVSERLPNRYRSETLILVVPQRIPTEYVRATVTTRIEDRLQSISQQILSRTRLERIINDLQPYGNEPAIMEELVDRMRKDIGIDIVRGEPAFRISYEAAEPGVAMRVTERLASLFIDENLREREVLAAGTSAFLESQLEEARQRLVEHEKTLEEYRRRFSSELPSQLPANVQAIQNAQFQVQSVVDALNRDRDRRLFLDRMIADLEAEVAAAVVAAPATPEGQRQELPAAVQLERARNALKALELRLKPDHPDVVRTKRVIQGLEAKVAEEPPPGEGAADPGTLAVLTPAQSATRNRLREMQAERENVERQIAYKQEEEQRLRGLIREYQTRAEAAPARESELIALTRDYDTLQETYRSLLGKHEEAKLAENLERRQVGEQFRILDPARLPERPSSPDRRKINTVGVLAGLFLGIGLVGLREYRDSSVASESDVRLALSLPVLAVIPVIMSDADRRRARLASVALSVAASGTIAACLVILVFTLRG